MDIQFTEEQELLRSSIQRLLRDQYDFDTRRKIVATEEGWSKKHWTPSLSSACWPRHLPRPLADSEEVRWRT